MHEAKQTGGNEVVIWGTGTPRREFLYSDDMAAACVHLLRLPEGRYGELFSDKAPPLVNIGSGKDLTIRDLADAVAQIVGFTGQLSFDTGKPDGTPRKLLDVEKIKSLGWQAKTSLATGITNAYTAYLEAP